MLEMDEDGGGAVEFDEFLSWYQRAQTARAGWAARMAKAAKSYMEAAIAGRDTGVKGAFKGGLQARMKAAAERQAQAQNAVETVVDLTADAIGASPRSAGHSLGRGGSEGWAGREGPQPFSFRPKLPPRFGRRSVSPPISPTALPTRSPLRRSPPPDSHEEILAQAEPVMPLEVVEARGTYAQQALEALHKLSGPPPPTPSAELDALGKVRAAKPRRWEGSRKSRTRALGSTSPELVLELDHGTALTRLRADLAEAKLTDMGRASQQRRAVPLFAMPSKRPEAKQKGEKRKGGAPALSL